ncbi:alpha/beta fold hydrolase [Fontimonas sp. SYSU GA230001]|uniref:esterase/lipase family protein n=1 Tax=Fontimonas sp. SYSU GA230001 TaxID=3142450 RepID=UPI0032B4805B
MILRVLQAIAVTSLTLFVLVSCGHGPGAQNDYSAEPALETSADLLEKSLICTPFEHPDKPAVLLVHGTFTAGFEQYDWTWLPLLAQNGYDVCTVTYPDRGLNDMQVSAEYVVHALRRMREETGRKVALIGHSQGVAVPRWALKWWPSARDAVDDFVMLAGPNHGTDQATMGGLFPLLSAVGLVPEVIYQFAPDSKFMQATNAGDETPGDISYTAIYTQFDELVQPVSPVPTAAIDFGLDNPKVTNVLIQDICPGRFVDHVTIGLTDRLTFDLMLDALAHPGPANVERAGGAALCGRVPIVPDQIVASAAVQNMIGVLRQEPANGLAQPHFASEEPPLKPYAQGALTAGGP